MTDPTLMLSMYLHPDPDWDAADNAVMLELTAASLDPLLHRAMALVQQRHGDFLAALAHLAAAEALESLEVRDPPLPAKSVVAAAAICQLATGFFMKQDFNAAWWWYQLVLQLDPENAVAYLNLVSIYTLAGRNAEADCCRDRAYHISRVFIDEAVGALVFAGTGTGNGTGTDNQERHPRRLLILCCGRTAGNIPFETLLSGGLSQRIRYVIDYAEVNEDSRLPPYDLVLNAIGDADAAAPLVARLASFMQTCPVPIVNAPAKVALTRRDYLPQQVNGLPGVVSAPCRLLRSGGAANAVNAANDINAVNDDHAHVDAMAGAADSGHGAMLDRILEQPDMIFPLLLRPTKSHGGQGLICCEDRSALLAGLGAAMAGDQYLTRFIDYRNADGFYRKYRVIFVDRQPYPYHLAISRHWMVHYVSAQMETDAWKIEEERAFLCDPGAVLGERAMAALCAIGFRFDLEYIGIDFTLLDDGRILVFEVNPTMLVHRVRANGILAYKNEFVQHIVDAVERMLVRSLTPVH